MPAGGLRNSPALSPALPFSSGGGGGGRDGAAHSGGSSAPGLGCCFWGGGGSGSGSGPARTVTIVRGSRRSRAEPLSSRRRRRRPWPPAFAPPAPGALRRPRPDFRTLRLRAAQPARRAPPPPPGARPRSLTIGPAECFPHRLQCVGGRHKASQAYTARFRRLWRGVPRRHLYAHCDTRHSDTRALSQTPRAASAHTHTHLQGPRGRI
ncbi:WAS/WASL-interacting protein family member 1-like [Symphalangus syndactylus]|uniref:WAS/WASL-interacting protein family member 1-like n=1 Tax=Symphalangus syndactylus TaxID=9590 RepID=UPI003006651E